MKKFLKVSLIAIALVFASCGDDNDDNEKNPLIGKWNLISESDCEKKTYFKFAEESFTWVDYELEEDEFEEDDCV